MYFKDPGIFKGSKHRSESSFSIIFTIALISLASLRTTALHGANRFEDNAVTNDHTAIELKCASFIGIVFEVCADGR